MLPGNSRIRGVLKAAFATRTDRRLSAGEKGLAFVHIPKCGGSSVNSAIVQAMQTSWGGHIPVKETSAVHDRLWPSASEIDRLRFLGNYRATLACERMDARYPFVSGHFFCSHEMLDAFQRDYRFLTILRNPRDRWISEFIYRKLRSLQSADATGLTVDKVVKQSAVELEEILANTQRSRLRGSNLSIFVSAGYSKKELIHEFMAQEALSVLNRFDHVLKLSSIDELAEVLDDLIRVPIQIEHTRKSDDHEPLPGLSRVLKELFTPEIREQIQTACQIDLELFDTYFDESN